VHNALANREYAYDIIPRQHRYSVASSPNPIAAALSAIEIFIKNVEIAHIIDYKYTQYDGSQTFLSKKV